MARAVADWWDAVELWLTQLPFPLQVVLAVLVLLPACWGGAAAIDRLWDLAAARLDRPPRIRRRLSAGFRPTAQLAGAAASALRNSEQPASTRSVGQLVPPGRSAVDDHHRHPEPVRVPDEPQPGHHRQRGPGHQQRAGAGRHRVDQRERAVHPLPRHVLAEEHHVRLEQPAAAGAGGEPEAVGGRQLGVAVRCGLDRRPGRARRSPG